MKRQIMMLSLISTIVCRQIGARVDLEFRLPNDVCLRQPKVKTTYQSPGQEVAFVNGEMVYNSHDKQALDAKGNKMAQKVLDKPVSTKVQKLARVMRQGAKVECDLIKQIAAIINLNAPNVDVILQRFNECSESA
jgi:hypothetical protein